MACYKKLDNQDQVFIEQNIFDKNELESYEAEFIINDQVKTSCLYYYENNDGRFYSLGLLQSLQGENIIIVEDDLTEIFKYKTAGTRRKYLYELIENHENYLNN